jgi:hypothetical protein
MGFNKKYIDKDITLKYLNSSNLSKLYSKFDSLIFDDELSLTVYKLFLQGKNESNIISKLKI